MVNTSATIQKNDDIYKKLHKVKFEGLFKNEYEKEQFNEEINKFLKPASEEKNVKKIIGKYNINSGNEYKVTNDYPFKQEKYSCIKF